MSKMHLRSSIRFGRGRTRDKGVVRRGWGRVAHVYFECFEWGQTKGKLALFKRGWLAAGRVLGVTDGGRGLIERELNSFA